MCVPLPGEHGSPPKIPGGATLIFGTTWGVGIINLAHGCLHTHGCLPTCMFAHVCPHMYLHTCTETELMDIEESTGGGGGAPSYDIADAADDYY